jgi:hypothetical protein|tara:strand:- start:1044 stop:1226 length:183 start_codon:yes stop_codon:yes gene_type:complete
MEKKVIKNKAIKKVKVDLTNLADQVDIIALKDKHLKEGATYNVTKATAILLINKGAAKLK